MVCLRSGIINPDQQLGKAEDWIDYEQSRSVDIPFDGLLGTITVHSAHHFDFDGALTGQDLQSIAAQIVQHPQFKGE